MFLWLKTLYRKRAVTWPFIFYTIIWTLSIGVFLSKQLKTEQVRKVYQVVILLVVLINVYNGVQLI